MGRLRDIPAWALAAALSALYLVLDPPSADLAAQTYRAGLFEREGFVLWDNAWYGGHHVPAYSVLFPPLAALIGARLTGALAAVAAAALFERLVAGRGAGARPAALWFATATQISLMTGRLTFALGVAVALAAALAAARDRRTGALVLAGLTALASPVAAAFLALLATTWALVARRFLGAGMAGAAVAPAAVLTLAFPEGGDFPFAASSFWPAVALTAAVGLSIPREAVLLRAGAAATGGLLVAAFVTDTAMGGNAARLAVLLGGPVAALALWPRRRLALALLAPALALWQWSTPADDWIQAAGDRSVESAYYAAPLRFLESQPGPVRVEVPFSDNHWESAHMAPRVDLARGWQRQLDRHLNPLFYEGSLTPARYRAWLLDNAVSHVALHDAPMDYSSAQEAAIVRARPPWLREVFSDEHWRVFEVRAARPLARGGRVLEVGADRVRVSAESVRVALRFHWSPFWELSGVAGCVARDGEWLRVTLARPGAFTLRMRFSPGRVGSSSSRCSS